MQRDVAAKPIDPSIDRIEFVAGIASRLSSERHIPNACLVILEEAMALTGASCGEVLFRDTRSGRVTCLANRGPHPWCISETGGRSLSTRLLETTFQDNLPLFIPSVPSATGLGLHVESGSELQQALSLPLVVRGRAIGAINLCGSMAARFPGDTVAALSVLSGLLALTIENMFIHDRSAAEDDGSRQFVVREMEASEDERQRIARELHDGIGQTLTALLMNIDTAASFLAQPGREGQAQVQIDKARDLAAFVLQDIRRVIVALRPTALDDLGLASAVDVYARRVLGEAGIDLVLRSRRFNCRLSSVMENAMFRVTQEAVNNVARHSSATQCRITLSATENRVTAVIEDDGVGFNTESMDGSYDHFGISGMRERVRVLGGSLRVRSRPGFGTKLTVDMPCEREEAPGEEPRSRS